MKATDIIIFCGQSNMQGQTEVLSECEAVEGAFEYKYLSDSFVPLCNPVGEDIRYDRLLGEVFRSVDQLPKWHIDHAFGSASHGHTNLVPEFCRAYIKNTGASVIAVHAAKGSTDIAAWLPSSNGYTLLTEKAGAAIKKAKTVFSVRHVYFVWFQGESDAVFGNSKDHYKTKLKELARSLQADLGIEKFGIIRVGRFTCDERDDEIISAQDEVCSEESFFLMLTDAAAGFCEECGAMMNPLVGGHYSAAGLEALGSLAGDTLGRFVGS